MALVALGKLGFDKILAIAGRDIAPEFLAQLIVKLAISPQKPRLQKRRANRDVLLAKAHAFRDRAGRVADLQPDIPQHMQDELDDAFIPGRLFERADEQKIDVGGWRQQSAAISARGDNG